MADVYGTETDEAITGTSTDDRLFGRGGNDRLRGRGGNDQLYGEEGDDSLNGESGADLMFGGAGNDTYYVDNAGDVVCEETAAGVDDGGTDRVYSSISYTLTNFVERLTLSDGAGAIDGTGNVLANKLTGNEADNVLTGLGGNDTLVGGLGADTFAFGPADATSTDKVLDFAAEDWIGIKASDYGLALGSGLLLDGFSTLVLDPRYFATVSGSTVQGMATGHGQFVYNTTTLTLMWDADGSGSLPGIALATFNTGVVLSAADFAIADVPPAVGDVSVSDVTVAEGDDGTTTATFTVSRTGGSAAFTVDYATADGTASAGLDYVASSGTLSFAAGQASQTVSVTIAGDLDVEPNETFVLALANASNGGTIVAGQGLGTIGNDDAVGEVSVSDVTVGEGDSGEMSLLSFTEEPTGLAFDPVTGHLFVSDDRAYKVFWVDPANPTVKLGEFSTTPLGGSDPEDIAVDPVTGHLFICNGSGNTNTPAIIETDSTGTQVFSTIAMPSVITDSEALAYDAARDLFYVGGKFSATIWCIDRNGTILDTIDILASYPRSDGGRVRITDLELAPSSDPNDGAKLSLYVTDYGADQVNDGRLFEIQGLAAEEEIGVVAIHDTTLIGSPDPSGLAYVPGLDTLFLSDSEANEAPFFGSNNLFALKTDGTLKPSGTTTATFTVSRTGSAAFTVDFATADGTATAGLDYVASAGTLSFAAGQASQTVSVTISGDPDFEPDETFALNLSTVTNGGQIVDGQGLATIDNDEVGVVAVHDTTLFGSPDPSGLAYVPGLDTLFLCDSEVDETPFFGANNLFALGTDGSLKPNGQMSLLSLTREPTGLAFDPVTGHLFVSDDRAYKVFWVDPANPTIKLGEFSTTPLGGSDPEDIAVDPVTGHLFICNGSGNTNTPAIIETDSTGSQVFSTIAMPSVITDSEALAYDAARDVFYVGGKFSATIWCIDRNGTILDTIDILASYPRSDGGRVRITDLELAPSSDPNDGAKLNLYVTDYGADQVNDGRLFEIHLGDPFWA